MTPAPKNVRIDYQVIDRLIEPGARVLDMGCGDGELLHFLVTEKKVQGQGIELSEDAIYKCVEKGLSVIHSDIDKGLNDYPNRSFDYVILNEALQEIRKVDYVMQEALRVGKKVIVGFPNFAHCNVRLKLFFRGSAPVTPALPYHWHDTPNLRFLSIRDFQDYCAEQNIEVLEKHYLGKETEITLFPNVFALNAIFLVTRRIST